MQNNPGFNFGEVLTRAWQITWKHKVLWLFGILAGCSQNNGGGGGGGNTTYQTGPSDFPADIPMPGWMREFAFTFERWGNNLGQTEFILIIVGLVLLGILFGLLFAALGTVGKIGLVQGTVQADQGADSFTFGELFNSGKPFFWRVFGLNLLVGIAIFALVIILFVPLGIFAAITLGIGVLCFIPLLCVFIPAMLLLSIVIEQANIALITEDLPIMDALKRGWAVFKEDWGVMVLMALILNLGIGLIVGFILALPFILVALPVLLVMFGGSQATTGVGLLLVGLCVVVYLPILIVANGILVGYIQSGWTLTYLRLTGMQGAGPIAVEAIEPGDPDLPVPEDE